MRVRVQQCRVQFQVHGMKNSSPRPCVLRKDFFEFLRSQSSVSACMVEVGHKQFFEKDVIKTPFVKVT